MKKIISLIVLLCLTWVTLIGAAQENSKVGAVGMATIHNNIVDIARDKAIDNALRTTLWGRTLALVWIRPPPSIGFSR
jgi:hypothetical protein